ncbi:ATP synthase subunit I [Fusibacter paucivorans]|uniref:ATP synthase subunit I n=1 Tax=Fusibacter paucivorans TaxID=76009 RepID=A0ABS5PLQ6_9FIRM|nr:ATP synthase subunit I [Fusibacter paucivorans]MBS7525817.1 ATP synthase subunit I [Fusibacter paucivorans]
MDETRKLQRNYLIYLLIADIVFVVLAFIFLEAPLAFVYGLVFGSAISALNFVELGNTLRRAVTMSPAKAQGYATRKYFVRYIVTGVVLYVSIVAPYINVLGTIIGMTIIKFIIFATNLFNDKQYYKNIFKRKEDEPSGH